MNTGPTNTLAPSAKYDDQGLFFSIILGVCLTVVLCPCVLYLSSTSTLWLKRLYRPNHTIEPPPVTNPLGPSAPSSPNSIQNGVDGFQSGGSVPSSPRPPSMPPRSSLDDVRTPSGAAPIVRSDHGRRKRLGISLPYASTFYALPRWRDWCSVEEHVPHLQSALAEYRQEGTENARAANPNRAMHEATEAGKRGRGDSPQADGGAGVPTSPDSFVSPGSIDYRQPAGTRMLAALVYTPTSGAGMTLQQRHGEHDEHTPLSARGRGDVAGSCFPGEATTAAAGVDVRTGGPVTYGTVSAVPDRRSVTSGVDPMSGAADQLPRTPLDPQVALYIFTLKYFITFLTVGCVFVCWICWIASGDDASEWMLLRNDPHRCGRQHVNETGCLLLQPYCAFLGSDIGCTAVPLPGLYDLTVKNIRPRSGLWWWVGLLNVGFVASFIAVTMYFMQAADVYITKVMKLQMSHAMGYRVACVCGLGEQKKSTRRKFEKLYLSADAYFPAAALTADGEPEGRGANTRLTQKNTVTVSPAQRSSVAKVRSASEALQETVYRRLSCPGMSCLFSIARVHSYETTLEQLVFAKPGYVKAILFTRKAPEDMYPAIHAAETAIAELQEAIAQQNALTRQKRYHQRTRGASRAVTEDTDGDLFVVSPSSPSSGLRRHPDAEALGGSDRGGRVDAGMRDGPVLYQYVGCCHRVSAVPYREEAFRKWGTHLDMLLKQVPTQHATGAVFVEFKNSRSAFEFVNVFEARYGGVSSRASALIAGPPGHIIKRNLDVDKFILALRFLLLLALYVLLLLTWSIPVGFLGSLDNIALVLGPTFRAWLYEDVPVWIRSLAVAYLPVIVLALFNVLLPFLIRFMVIAMGAVTKSECDGGHLYLQYIFMVLTAVVFQAALQGSLAEAPNLAQNMGADQIMELLVSCVTPQSGYWYAKIIMSTALSTWLDVLDPIALLGAIFLRNRAHVQRRYDAIFRPTDFEYPRLYSFDIMVLSIGVLFHMTAPLLVPFVALFFVARYMTQRAKLYDRYRPAFTAPHDCTDFGVSAQVMRAVITLLCFAELCGLVVMSLKKHSGGMILSAMTLGASLVLAVYIYIQTRTWVTTLGNARRFFPDDVYTPPTASTAVTAGAAPAPHVSVRAEEGPPPVSTVPVTVRVKSGGEVGTEFDEDARCETDSTVSSVRTFSDVSGATESPRACSAGPYPRVNSGLSGPRSTDDNNKGYSDKKTRVTCVDAAAETAVPHTVTRPRRRPREVAALLQEDDVMDAYEYLNVLPSISGRSTNPYVGHLLPRKPGLRHLYQPKHQRLAIIDVDKEVDAMMETEFVVERYWDRGMTWFEADATDRQEATSRITASTVLMTPRVKRRRAGGSPRSQMPPPAHRTSLSPSPSSSSLNESPQPVSQREEPVAPATARVAASWERESTRAASEDFELLIAPNANKDAGSQEEL